MKIGLVKGLFYYEYKDLIEVFFEELGINLITSSNTKRTTIDEGKKYLDSESCLSMKIYFGHLKELASICHYVIVERIPSMKENELMCTNFYILYDLCHNYFDNIIDINIDYNNKIDIKKSMYNLGKKLGLNDKDIDSSFNKAYSIYLDKKIDNYQNELIKLRSNKKKILILGHPYNLNDDYLMYDIKKVLKDNEIEIIKPSYFNDEDQSYLNISHDVYFSTSIDLLNQIEKFKKRINGIILLSVFPCSIDCLVNEMIMRKVKLPILNLVIDEENDNSGITTRIESFVDIINMEDNYVKD